MSLLIIHLQFMICRSTSVHLYFHLTNVFGPHSSGVVLKESENLKIDCRGCQDGPYRPQLNVMKRL